MSRTLIENARLFTPERPSYIGWLLTDEGKISDFGEGAAPADLAGNVDEIIQAKGQNLLPGLIDIHTHGCLGYDTMDADPEAIMKIAAFHVTHGVTTYLPTTLTANTENTVKAIRCVTGLVGKRGKFAKIPGIHLEGPFFNPAKCGAQDTEFIRRASIEECKTFLNAGIIKRISIAPEYPENLNAADLFHAEGISISAGHTNAAYTDMVEALNHGFTSVTHLYNGMSSFTHREPGAAGAALTLDGYSCEIICDNIHVHPAAQNLAWRAKGRDKMVLITDMIRPSGLPDGHYESKEMIVNVSHNGTELRIPNGALCGSALTMDRGLRNFTANSGATLDETWPCGSLNAARLIGIDKETGSIEKGKAADLVLMNADYQVKMTMIEGIQVFVNEE